MSEEKRHSTGLTSREAQEFHKYFMLGFIVFTVIAIVAHFLVPGALGARPPQASRDPDAQGAPCMRSTRSRPARASAFHSSTEPSGPSCTQVPYLSTMYIVGIAPGFTARCTKAR